MSMEVNHEHSLYIEPDETVSHAAIIYYLLDEKQNLIKIGTTTDLHDRMCHYHTCSPHLLKWIAAEPGGRDRELEIIHRFIVDQYRSEWFNLSDQLRDYLSDKRQVAGFLSDNKIWLDPASIAARLVDEKQLSTVSEKPAWAKAPEPEIQNREEPVYRWVFQSEAKFPQKLARGGMIQTGECYWFYGGNFAADDAPEAVKQLSPKYQQYLKQQGRK